MPFFTLHGRYCATVTAMQAALTSHSPTRSVVVEPRTSGASYFYAVPSPEHRIPRSAHGQEARPVHNFTGSLCNGHRHHGELMMEVNKYGGDDNDK